MRKAQLIWFGLSCCVSVVLAAGCSSDDKSSSGFSSNGTDGSAGTANVGSPDSGSATQASALVPSGHHVTCKTIKALSYNYTWSIPYECKCEVRVTSETIKNDDPLESPLSDCSPTDPRTPEQKIDILKIANDIYEKEDYQTYKAPSYPETADWANMCCAEADYPKRANAKCFCLKDGVSDCRNEATLFKVPSCSGDVKQIEKIEKPD